MPTHPYNSPASSRGLASTSDNEPHTPSPPPQESSHNEYTPEHSSHAESTTSQFISPSTRSDTTGSLPSDVRAAIHELYKEIYGEDSQRCLVTLSKRSVIIAHVVQRASKHHQVSHVFVMSSWLIFSLVDGLRILLWVKFSRFSCGQQEKSFLPCVA
jgi:hypothetical protein